MLYFNSTNGLNIYICISACTGFDDPTGDREGDGEPDIPLTVILTEDKYAVCIGVGVASYSAKYREAR